MTKRWFWAILLVAFVLRLGFALTRADLADSADEHHWDGMAWSMVRLGILHPDVGVYRPPLYGLFLAGIYKTFGHSLVAVRLVQCVMGTATCWLLYLLGCRLGASKTGLIAAGLGAIYPFFVFFAGILMAETLLVFLTLGCLVLFFLFWDCPDIKHAICFGFLVGVSVLCKPILLPWLPLVLGCWWRVSDLNASKKWGRVVVVLGVVFLVIFPWTWRNYIVSGHWVPISANTGVNVMIGALAESNGRYQNGMDYLAIYRGLAGTSDFVVGDRTVIPAVLQWMGDDPILFFVLCVKKMIWFWSPWIPDESLLRNVVALVSSGPVLLLGVMGTFYLRRRPEGQAVLLLMISMSVLHMVFFSHVRFRLPIDGALCVMTAWTIDHFGHFLRTSHDA